MIPVGTVIRVISEGPFETGCKGAIAIVIPEEMIRGEFVSGLLPRTEETFVIEVIDNTDMPELFNNRKYWRVFTFGEYEVLAKADKHLYEYYLCMEEV